MKQQEKQNKELEKKFNTLQQKYKTQQQEIHVLKQRIIIKSNTGNILQRTTRYCINKLTNNK